GKLSASGEADYSEIRASALSRFWRELLGLTAELALEPKLAPEEVDRERDFLLWRLQRRRDNAPSRAFDEFYALLYGRHPYSIPVLGTSASIARFDHAAVVERYRAFYRPDRMVLAVSGQVPVDEVLAEVQRRFGALPPGRYAMDRRTSERLAWYLAFYDVEGVGAEYPERYRRAVQAVTAADVQRAATTYLAAPVTLVLGPRPPR